MTTGTEIGARAPELTDDARSPKLSTAEERRLGQALGVHFAGVWRALRRFGVEASAADDAAQQVFGIFAARMTQVAAGRERAFLLGVSVRVAANFRRKQRRLREVHDSGAADTHSPLSDPESLLIQKQRLERLDTALGTLPEEQRAVFALYEIEGLSLPEVAQALHIKLGTATSRLARARARFETWVEQNLVRGHHD